MRAKKAPSLRKGTAWQLKKKMEEEKKSVGVEATHPKGR